MTHKTRIFFNQDLFITNKTQRQTRK